MQEGAGTLLKLIAVVPEFAWPSLAASSHHFSTCE